MVRQLPYLNAVTLHAVTLDADTLDDDPSARTAPTLGDLQ
jgi:hypothetical protein